MSYANQTTTVPTPSTEVSVVVGGTSLSGWQRVRITRGCERVPSDFEMSVTEHFPSQPTDIVIVPGSPCTVMIGNVPIINRYIDVYGANVSPTSHEITISGRSKCCDLVDCSAVLPNSQIGACQPMALAQALCKPFGITVSGSAPGPQLPQLNLILGETPFEVLEKVARYSAVLVYDDTNGNLVMEKVGSTSHASGFAESVNAQQWAVDFTMNERFSAYSAVLFSFANMMQLGDGGNLLGVATDPGVPRYRPMIIVSEQFVMGQPIALQRARWEAQRRRGRSQKLNLVCDCWHDSAGTLWTPNALAPMTFPTVKLPVGTNWIISEVSFIKDLESGTTAEVTLMPPEAFTTEPSDLQAYDVQLQQALASTAPAATD